MHHLRSRKRCQTRTGINGLKRKPAAAACHDHQKGSLERVVNLYPSSVSTAQNRFALRNSCSNSHIELRTEPRSEVNICKNTCRCMLYNFPLQRHAMLPKIFFAPHASHNHASTGSAFLRYDSRFSLSFAGSLPAASITSTLCCSSTISTCPGLLGLILVF